VARSRRTDPLVPREVVERAKRDLRRESHLTPFRLAQKYDITISVAKKILRILEEEGLIIRVGGRMESKMGLVF